MWYVVGAAHEGLNGIKTHRQSAIIVKDISKPYDHTCWLYLWLLLIQFGFLVRIVVCIMGDMESVSYVVLANESTSCFLVSSPTRFFTKVAPFFKSFFCYLLKVLVYPYLKTREPKGCKA